MSNQKSSQKKMLRVFLGILMLLPGLMIWGVYEWVVATWPDYALGLYGAKEKVAGTIASYAFTMLGFLAAVITILFSFTSSENFKRYNRKGHLGNFLIIYLIAIANLVVLAFLCLPAFSSNDFIFSFKGMIIFFTNSLVHVFLIAVVIVNLVKNSLTE